MTDEGERGEEQHAGVLIVDVLKLPHKQPLIINKSLTAEQFAYCSLQLDTVIDRFVGQNAPIRFKNRQDTSYNEYLSWIEALFQREQSSRRNKQLEVFTQRLGFSLDESAVEFISQALTTIDERYSKKHVLTPEVLLDVSQILRGLESKWSSSAKPLFYVSTYVLCHIIETSYPQYASTSIDDKTKYEILKSLLSRLHDASSQFHPFLVSNPEAKNRFWKAFASDAAYDAHDLDTHRKIIGVEKPLKGRHSRQPDPGKKSVQKG